MATAKQDGGLYYDAVKKQMVDAEGKEVKGAEKPEKDTLPEAQPGAAGNATPEQRLASAIAEAINPKSAKK